MKRSLWIGMALALAAVAFSVSRCSTSYARRDPTGEAFPSVRGTALNGQEVALPAVGQGEPMLLLIGFEQNAQFDLDRWLLGLSEAKVALRAYEVPTIPGMIPGMISGVIDGGMRRGIPEEDWGGVVTVYGDAARVAQFVGDEDGLTGRVLLLDGEGRVVFFHDRGYSVSALERLRDALAQLQRACKAPISVETRSSPTEAAGVPSSRNTLPAMIGAIAISTREITDRAPSSRNVCRPR